MHAFFIQSREAYQNRKQIKCSIVALLTVFLSQDLVSVNRDLILTEQMCFLQMLDSDSMKAKF